MCLFFSIIDSFLTLFFTFTSIQIVKLKKQHRLAIESLCYKVSSIATTHLLPECVVVLVGFRRLTAMTCLYVTLRFRGDCSQYRGEVRRIYL